MKIIRRLFEAIRSYPGKKVLGKALSVSVLNQAVSSGTNFIFGVYLVRMLLPEDFGLYGIGFAISLFYSGFGNALFLTQMVVHTPDKAPEDRLPYAARMFLLVIFFCIATLFLFVLLWMMGSFVWESVAQYTELAYAIMGASITYLLKDFLVRHAYNMRRELWALVIHGAIACTMVILLCLQYLLVIPLNVEMALWIYTAAQTAGVVLGYRLARLPVAGCQWSMLQGDFLEALHGGKWASITNLVYFARTQAHTIVVTVILGPAGVAKLNAARLLVTPAVMLTPALSQIAIPRLATVRGQGMYQLVKLGKWITFALLGVALLYSAILLTGYDFIVDKTLGENYQNLFLITLLWCLYTCLLALRNGAEMVGQVMKKFRQLNSANTYAAIVSLAATYWLTVSYGLPGALIGLASGEILLIVLLYYFLLASLPTKSILMK